MTILLVSVDYSEKSSKVAAKMLKQLALEFVRRGEKVIVIAPDEELVTEQYKVTSDSGIEVWHFKSGPLQNIPHIQRGINESLLSYKAWRALKHKILNTKIDSVVFYTPTIFFGPLIKKIAKKKQVPVYMIMRDFFPQWLIDVGIISKHSLFAHYFRFVEKINYKASTKIGVMSPNNLALFNQLHPKFTDKAEVLYNWTDTTKNLPKASFPSIRDQFNLKDKVIFFYGGNIGHAQDMKNLMNLAIALKDDHMAHFLFIGDGDEVQLIKEIAATHQLNNFTHISYISQEEYLSVLSEIDIGLFSLAKTHTAHNFPGKVFGYMAEKVPVLGSVNPGNDLIDIINQSTAGFISVNGDIDQLLTHAKQLLSSQVLREKCGTNGYHLLQRQFSTQKAAETILNEISKNDLNIKK